MKLEAFRVENYKKIHDTGWIKCEDLTVFVGKNESGKSALFRGLSKLKPTDGEKYNGLKEFPHGRYTDEFDEQDWRVASARFALTADDKKELTQIGSFLSKTKTVTLTRCYSDTLTVAFDPKPELPTVLPAEWTAYLEESMATIEHSVAPDEQGDNWAPKKKSLGDQFRKQIQDVEALTSCPTVQLAQQVRQQIASQMNEQWAKDILQPLLATLTSIEEKLKSAFPRDRGRPERGQTASSKSAGLR